MKTTKQLARELGLLRERKLSSSSGDTKKRQKLLQGFNYLIVIDFESTCWERDKSKTQEIIEFPAVLLNTKTGEVESEFHYYVQPQENPTLSAFCQQLTGISQNQVDNGIPISLCLRKFSHWLHKLYQEKRIQMAGSQAAHTENGAFNSAAFVTWSDWDLGVCLHYELRRKQISKAPCFNQWIDIRATYTKFYGRKPKGLNGALQDVGIEFEGREHSGLHDSRNTATLAWRMIRDGCVMNITKSLTPGSVTSVHPSVQPAASRIRKTPKKTTPKKTPATKTNKIQKGGNPAFTCYEDSNSAMNSVTRKSDLPGSHSTPSKCLQVRDPNVPQSVDDGNAKKSFLSQKRPAMFTPEKSSMSKCMKLLTPEKSDGQLPANGQRTSPRNKQHNKPSLCDVEPTHRLLADSNQATASDPVTISKGVHSSSGFVAASRLLAAATDGSFKKPTPPSTPMASVNSCMGSALKPQNSRIPQPTSTIPTNPMQNNQTAKLTAASSNAAAQSNTRHSPSKDKCQVSKIPVPQSLKTPSPPQYISLHHTSVSSDNACQTPVSLHRSSNCNAMSLRTSVNSAGTPATPQSSAMDNTAPFRTPQNLAMSSSGSVQTSVASTGPFTTLQSTPMTSYSTFRTPHNSGAIGSFRTPHCSGSSGSFTTLQNSRVTPAGSFRTPQHPVTTSFRTPHNPPKSSASSMKATPPLCQCGRRAKRRMVQNPGPNMGRWFFSCVKGSANSDNTSSCGFFKWESPSPGSVTPASRKASFNKSAGATSPFTPVLQVPGSQAVQRRLGLSSVGAKSLR